MSGILIPTMEETSGLDVSESPFHRLSSLSRSRLAATRNIPAADRRLLVEDLVTAFQWENIRHLFPLPLSVPGVLVFVVPIISGFLQTTSNLSMI